VEDLHRSRYNSTNKHNLIKYVYKKIKKRYVMIFNNIFPKLKKAKINNCLFFTELLLGVLLDYF